MNNKEQERKKLTEILANPLKKNESGENAQKILDNHIGFPREKAKFASDVYLYAAVEDGKYKSEKKVFCYDGKPGTGKTTFIKTLNRAMGRGELQIISCAGLKEFKDYSILGDENKPSLVAWVMLKSGCKNPIIPLDELEKISDEQAQRDLIELFKMYKNEGKEKSKKLFDKYYQMDIELDYITFFATVNYSDQLVPALKKEVEMRKLEDYSDEDKEKILELKKKEIEAEIKKIYPDEKNEIIPREIIKILPKYINEKGIRQTERALFKIKKEYIEARENGREFSLGDPKEWLKKNVLAYQESFSPQLKHYFLFLLGGIIWILLLAVIIKKIILRKIDKIVCSSPKTNKDILSDKVKNRPDILSEVKIDENILPSKAKNRKRKTSKN
ncbi:MAG: ATP-dependent protease La [Mycoplasmataceae bacterium RV_VA103A]|nr:MAG: ATP-dependent protease La [Mycoplasmataceae bacterium RV_VA103A]